MTDELLPLISDVLISIGNNLPPPGGVCGIDVVVASELARWTVNTIRAAFDEDDCRIRLYVEPYGDTTQSRVRVRVFGNSEP